MKIELTEDWLQFKKGDVIERSRDIAYIHIGSLKNAKPYVEKKVEKPKRGRKPKK